MQEGRPHLRLCSNMGSVRKLWVTKLMHLLMHLRMTKLMHEGGRPRSLRRLMLVQSTMMQLAQLRSLLRWRRMA